MDTNLFTLLRKLWLFLNRFSRNSSLLDKFYKELLSRIPLAKEEIVLGSVINRLTETGRRSRMCMSVGKIKVTSNSRQLSPIQIMIGQKQPENVDCFSYVDIGITYNARFTGVIKSRIAMAKAAFKKKMKKWVG